jgi:hypothetical protein
MLTVTELIARLKKMPRDLPVGVAMHDNSENEVAGWVQSVYEGTDDETTYGGLRIKEGMACVIIQC